MPRVANGEFGGFLMMRHRCGRWRGLLLALVRRDLHFRVMTMSGVRVRTIFMPWPGKMLNSCERRSSIQA